MNQPLRVSGISVPVKFAVSLLLLFSSKLLMASGVQGVVSDEKGDPLPFVSIFEPQTGKGTVSNEAGYYQISLDPGTYALSFQYLGYETKEIRVTIGEGLFTNKDVVLRPQTYNLQTIEIRDGQEDPAYSIMRKAIAKAPYHHQQVASYDAKVYIKGSGQLLDAPFLVRRALEKEGLDSSFAFVMESISEIHFEQPDRYKERVLSIRQQGNDNQSSPMPYINSSFYEPKVVEAISPLSARAFSYYRFVFEGSYIEKGQEINKIRVIPKSKGPGLFEGSLYILEDLWSIHSLDLETFQNGFAIRLKQVCRKQTDNIWMPSTHEIILKGTILGFRFQYLYLATVSDYQLQKNPNLPDFQPLVDEEAEMTPWINPKDAEPESKETLTLREARKLMKEYEKEEKKKQEEPQVISGYERTIDSSAYRRDSSFWATARPLPLTPIEIKSYRRTDSLSEVKRDTTNKTTKEGTFSFSDLILGERYKLGKSSYFRLISPLLFSEMNTVEGWALSFPMQFEHEIQPSNEFKYGIKPRVAFSRSRKLSGTAYAKYQFGEGLSKGQFNLEGGRYVYQIREAGQISPLVNTYLILFQERNLMKIYEKEFFNLSWVQPVFKNLKFSFNAEWSQRYQLQNNPTGKWLDFENRAFTSNVPENEELGNTEFETHQIAWVQGGISWNPFQKYTLNNGRLSIASTFNPKLFADWKIAPKDVFSGDMDYQLLSGGVQLRQGYGAGSKIMVDLVAGKFLRAETMTFLDFYHFKGRETRVADNEPNSTYRLLPYYQFSTADYFIEARLHQQFRKLAFTQIPFVWKSGIKENIFLNYLRTPTTNNYLELGYTLDNIRKLFRIEVVASFDDFSYKDFGVLFGISTVISESFMEASESQGIDFSLGF